MMRVSDTLQELLEDLQNRRDDELSTAMEVLPQYVQDHSDKEAYREIDRQIDALARAFDRMEAFLEKAITKAQSIEDSVESFYGE